MNILSGDILNLKEPVLIEKIKKIGETWKSKGTLT